MVGAKHYGLEMDPTKKKIEELFFLNKSRLNLTDKFISELMDLDIEVDKLHCFFTYLYKNNVGFSVDGLKSQLECKNSNLNEWLECLFILNSWLVNQKKWAKLADLKGYFLCLLEMYQNERNVSSLPDFTLEKVTEYGIDNSVSIET